MTHPSLLAELPGIVEGYFSDDNVPVHNLHWLMMLFWLHKLQPMLFSLQLQEHCVRLQEQPMDTICS